jgi:tRNA-adenosine deaminase
MCAGAIINAHIPKVYFGAYDLKNGACGTITNLFQMPFNFKPESVGGIMLEECSKLLTDFFKNLRNKKS